MNWTLSVNLFESETFNTDKILQPLEEAVRQSVSCPDMLGLEDVKE